MVPVLIHYKPINTHISIKNQSLKELLIAYSTIGTVIHWTGLHTKNI